MPQVTSSSRDHQMQEYIRMFYINSILYSLAIASVKASILEFYRSVFGQTANQSFRNMIWALEVLTGLWCMTSVTHAIMICEPRSKIWKMHVEGICGNLIAHFLTLSIIDILMDIAVWMLPIPTLWRLEIPVKTKVGIITIFGLGIL
ncbi:hypothetical protein BS50DRAFT_575979 [Corynespora cassiicola Philippines]|uniref:Rhodopsin domain-containing protein n=1 Tax=Corynespora cassiicola Philippines TaxID=1448308 RepID=A0A2T2NGL6_CORCC|nr:hypothetical protein BS50DRAFT_575979 [Corynespora cassiicola Philippines]